MLTVSRCFIMANSGKREQVAAALTSLNTSIQERGKDILSTVLPQKILVLDTMLKETEAFNIDRSAILPELPALPVSGSNGQGSRKRKKRRIAHEREDSEGTSTDSEDHERDYPNDVSIACNQKLVDMMDSLKKQLEECVELVGDVKIWIQLLIPKIEDGNNFGVGVQEEVVGELGRIEDHAFSQLDGLAKYFQTRAKIVSKMLKHRNVADYRQSLLEVDEMEFVNLRLCLVDLRNNFVIIYDLLLKNLERVQKPRSDHNVSSGMYD